MHTPPSAVNNSPLSISALNQQVRARLEESFPLLWVAGEISNLTRAASGHLYFSLKDKDAQVRCVMWRSRAQTLGWQPQNGAQVEARVLVSFYEPRGEFQLSVEVLRQAGQGNGRERSKGGHVLAHNVCLPVGWRDHTGPDYHGGHAAGQQLSGGGRGDRQMTSRDRSPGDCVEPGAPSV